MKDNIYQREYDDALNLAGIDMDDWTEEQGWDNWDYGALEMEW